MVLVFIDREVETELFKDFNWALNLDSIELSGDFSISTSEKLELFTFKKILEVRDISYNLFEDDATSLDKFWVVVVLHFHVADINGVGHLLRDGGDVASGPAIGERLVEGLEFIESPLHGEFACGITASHCVLGDFAHFLGLGDGEIMASLLCFILVVLDGTLNLLSLAVEGENLRDELRLCIGGPLTQVHFTGSHRLLRATSSCIGI